MASSARLDELRKKFEENPRRYFAPLANEYRKAGDTNQAIAICREYLPQQPGHMSGHIVFGQALYEARQFEEAKTVFETALSLDPENLIALRHLGDISLILNDTDAARGWYRRVLDADPRNEEIQGQLAALEKAAAAAPTPAVTPAQPAGPAAPAAPPKPVKPTPSSAATVVVQAVKMPPKPGTHVTATSPTAEVRLDEIVPPAAPPAPPAPTELPASAIEKSTEATLEIQTSAVTQPPHDGHASPSAAPHAAIEGLESHTSSAEAPPLDSFSLEGLETTSMAAPPAPPPAPAPVLSGVEDVEPLDLDLGSVGAPSPPPPVEPAPVPVAEAAPAAAPDLVFIAPEPEPAQPSEPAPLPALEFEEPAPPAATESGPFVTETMAELYLQQGHREEALRVYRALIDQRPHDSALRERVRRIESEMSAPSAGLRFGDVLSMVAQRRPGFRQEFANDGAAPAPPVPEMLPEPLYAAPAAAEYVAPEPPEVAPPASDRGDMLAPGLGFGTASAADEHAAVTLATAFATNGARAPISGAPARQASTELSLDSVFGAEQRQSGPPPSSFSFDQFFAKGDAGKAGASGPESAEEVAHFTQWLEGLKRK